MKTYLRFTAILLIAISSGAPRADVVYLQDGKTIEGKVTRNDLEKTYRIETTRGTVIKPIGDVQRVVKAPLPQDVFLKRFASVDRESLDDLATLVTWTREKHLSSQKQKVCRLILKIDPNHEMARRELRYTVFENEWILEKELRKKQLQLGLVKYKGEWVSKDERERLEFKRDAQLLDTLFKSVQSDNRIVVDYAVRKIMGYDCQRPYELFMPYLESPHEIVRMIAVSALAKFPVVGKDGEMKPSAKADEAAHKLYKLALTEPSPDVIKATNICLRLFYPDETFRQALETLVGTGDPGGIERTGEIASRPAQPDETFRETLLEGGDPGIIERAGEIADFLLLKKRVPWVFNLLVIPKAPAGGGITEMKENAKIRELLREALGADLGYNLAAWEKWWEENQDRFTDVP